MRTPLLFGALLACAPADEPITGPEVADAPQAVDTAAPVDTAPPAPPAPQTFVIYRLDFARSEGGVSRGFDLDGDGGATATCGISDLTSPDGEPGIDNSFAGLLPLMEAAGGAAFEDLVQNAVDSGEFLLLVRLTDQPDGCVVFEVYRGDGAPLVGADGVTLGGQTMPVRPGGPIVRTDCATRVGDTVLASDLEMPVEIEIFDAAIALTLFRGSLRLTVTPNGAVGETGGLIDVDDLWRQIGPLGGIGTQLLGVLETLLFARADMSVDGSDACTHMSAVLAFEALPAFLYDVPPPEVGGNAP